jgi:phosphatidylglycerophosphate synthase
MVKLYADYRRSLKRPEAEELADLYIYRPLGFIVVKALYRTPITPNQLSLFSMFLGIMAGVFFGHGDERALVTGACFLFFSIVIDCSDGQLARLKKNGTPLGRLIDGLSDYVVGVAVYVGLGIGFAQEAGSPSYWWFLIAAAALSHGLHSLAFDYYRNRFLDSIRDGPSPSSIDDDIRKFQNENDQLRGRKRTLLRRAFIWTYLRYSLLQKKLNPGPDMSREAKAVDTEEFYRRNKVTIRLWSFLGSSTQGSILIAAALLRHLDFYFWGIIVVRNVWAAATYIVQHRMTARLEEEAEEKPS